MISCVQFDNGDFTKFVALHGLVSPTVHVMLEGTNPTGSIKIKPALAMIDRAEREGLLIPGKSRIIESSSGNMALAMSVICTERGYGFTCVTDINATAWALNGIKSSGAEVLIIDQRDQNGGFVATRRAELRRRLSLDPDLVWLNQYVNPANSEAHQRWTAQQIIRSFPRLDWLFLGVGTGGTFMGCAEAFARHSPDTRIVAVDPVGSITFGGTAARRLIPGIGNSQVPPLIDTTLASHFVMVEELAAVTMCRQIASHEGLALGGSSGSALAAVVEMRELFGADDQIVAISPDFGEAYRDTVYDDSWVAANYAPVCTTE
jgi:2,3-diaminopropionate biosynthesis protein SbnA